ncbi:T9SS type A sorting domain-containing protein [Bernardetia sp.]|uniref:T9SS type A sorting domain-containing protein n=1 Tax=Bernardetia sp. TaxID=1937974 RepID=UPI0025C4CDAA|nr:T9SS type A sorting domain-containing protein [Bernardetia sp.]
MKLKQFLPFSQKPPKWSDLSFQSLVKTILVVPMLFMAMSYFSSSYAQNLQAAGETDKIEISEAYPNPAAHFVQFDYRMLDRNSEGKITVYNLLGSVVGEYRLDNYDNRKQISVSNLKAGIYFYTISVNNQSLITKKFVVKH